MVARLWLTSEGSNKPSMVKAPTLRSGHLDSAAATRPDFFIVGAPKCGTTAMNHYLASHPDIFVAKKEMNVFGADLRFGHQFYRRDLQEFLAEFEGRRAQRRAGALLPATIARCA